VLGRSSWVVDLDEIPYPFIVGRTASSPAFRRRYRETWTPVFRERLGRRIRTMIDGYTHPSCRGVVFWTQSGVEQAVNTLESLGCHRLIDGLIEKSYVVRPAAAALPAHLVRTKWQSPECLRVVFCGRDFDTKDGDLALRVVASLQSAGANLTFTFIGSIPAHAWRRHGDVLRRITVLDSPPRRVVLAHMASAHILFQPSPTESLGMVLVEAAAAGLAVICSEGRDLAHLGELLPKRGTLRVNRDRGTLVEHEAAFRRHLSQLASRPREARDMAFRNHRFATSGPISIGRRNDVLHRIYERAGRGATCPPLTLKTLEESAHSTLTAIAERDLEALYVNAQRRQATHGARIFF
jgi:glycosyltransferase involved in cell wall biosynthesis